MTARIGVLQVLATLDRGGAETQVLEWLKRIDFTEFDICVVGARGQSPELEREIAQLGFEIRYSPRFGLRSLPAYVAWWHRTLSETSRWQVIHAHHTVPAALYLGLARSRGLATIAHSHNVPGLKSLKDLLRWTLQAPLRVLADELLACSNIAGTSMFGQGATVRVLPNGIDVDRFRFNTQAREKTRAALALNADEKVIGHVGSFRPVKNHIRLIEIFTRVLAREPSASLLLIGDGPEKSAVETAVKKNGLSGRVHFLGLRRDVPELLSAMDVLVFPSKSEGLGIALVEAQANGLPCVVSDVVPMEVRLTDLPRLITLDAPDDVWADEIERAIDKNKERDRYADLVADAGYDVRASADTLVSVYSSLAERALRR